MSDLYESIMVILLRLTLRELEDLPKVDFFLIKKSFLASLSCLVTGNPYFLPFPKSKVMVTGYSCF